MGAAPAPILHRYTPPPDKEEAFGYAARFSTKGVIELTDAGLAFFCEVYHHDTSKVPGALLDDVYEEEIRRCSDERTGFAYFLRWYGMVRIKGGKDRGWQTICVGGVPRVDVKTGNDWGWQLLLAEIYPIYEQLLVLKARQLGMTFLTANYILWKMLFFAGTAVGVVMNVLPNAKRLVNRVRETYARYPEWLRERVPVKNDSVMLFTLENGSSVEPSKEARSEALGLLVLDEFAHIKPAIRQEEIWASAEACADNGGQIIVHDTALGTGNLFHTWCMDSYLGEVEHTLAIDRVDGKTLECEVMTGDAGMGFVFLPYWLEPHRDDEWMQSKRKRYRGSLHMLQQEYPDTVEQAFVSSGLNFFSVLHLEEAAEEAKRLGDPDKPGGSRDVRVSLIWKDKEKRIVSFAPDPAGNTVIHGIDELIAQIKEGRPFVIGADAAGDDSWGDFQAASALCVGRPYGDATEEELAPPHQFVPHRQMVTIHGQLTADVYASELEKLGYLCNRAIIAVEANGIGAGVITNLRRVRYPRLYRRRNDQVAVKEKRTSSIGWWTDPKKKATAWGLLDKDLRMGAIEIRDIDTLSEMRGCQHLGSSRLGAPEPRHDDRVCGLSIARVVARGEILKLVQDVAPEHDPIMLELEKIEEELRDRGFGQLTVGNEMVASGY